MLKHYEFEYENRIFIFTKSYEQLLFKEKTKYLNKTIFDYCGDYLILPSELDFFFEYRNYQKQNDNDRYKEYFEKNYERFYNIEKRILLLFDIDFDYIGFIYYPEIHSFMLKNKLFHLNCCLERTKIVHSCKINKDVKNDDLLMCCVCSENDCKSLSPLIHKKTNYVFCLGSVCIKKYSGILFNDWNNIRKNGKNKCCSCNKLLIYNDNRLGVKNSDELFQEGDGYFCIYCWIEHKYPNRNFIEQFKPDVLDNYLIYHKDKRYKCSECLKVLYYFGENKNTEKKLNRTCFDCHIKQEKQTIIFEKFNNIIDNYVLFSENKENFFKLRGWAVCGSSKCDNVIKNTITFPKYCSYCTNIALVNGLWTKCECCFTLKYNSKKYCKNCSDNFKELNFKICCVYGCNRIIKDCKKTPWKKKCYICYHKLKND